MWQELYFFQLLFSGEPTDFLDYEILIAYMYISLPTVIPALIFSLRSKIKKAHSYIWLVLLFYAILDVGIISSITKWGRFSGAIFFSIFFDAIPLVLFAILTSVLNKKNNDEMFFILKMTAILIFLLKVIQFFGFFEVWVGFRDGMVGLSRPLFINRFSSYLIHNF